MFKKGTIGLFQNVRVDLAPDTQNPIHSLSVGLGNSLAGRQRRQLSGVFGRADIMRVTSGRWGELGRSQMAQWQWLLLHFLLVLPLAGGCFNLPSPPWQGGEGAGRWRHVSLGSVLLGHRGSQPLIQKYREEAKSVWPLGTGTPAGRIANV